MTVLPRPEVVRHVQTPVQAIRTNFREFLLPYSDSTLKNVSESLRGWVLSLCRKFSGRSSVCVFFSLFFFLSFNQSISLSFLAHTTLRRNLAIQRFSVVPLSTNSGLIGWVPNCDTLHTLIRDYREKKKLSPNLRGWRACNFPGKKYAVPSGRNGRAAPFPTI